MRVEDNYTLIQFKNIIIPLTFYEHKKLCM